MGELHQRCSLAIRVCPQVQAEQRAGGKGENSPQGRPSDTLFPSQGKAGRGHNGSCVARGYKRTHLAALEEVNPDND